MSECLGKIKPGMGAREAEKVSGTFTGTGVGDRWGRELVAIRTGREEDL